MQHETDMIIPKHRYSYNHTLTEQMADFEKRFAFIRKHMNEIFFDCTGYYQAMSLPYNFGDMLEAEQEDTVESLKVWLREMKRRVMRDGLGPIEKVSTDEEFGFFVPKLKMRFTIPTQVSCEMKPVLDEYGVPIVELKKHGKWVEFEVEEVRTEKVCMTLNVSDVDI